LVQENFWVGKQGFFGQILEAAVSKAATWVDERWNLELLKDGGITSAKNETSVVLYGNFGEHGHVLLTSDAGLNALRWASDYADNLGLALRDFALVQIPHHGSRHNVGPSVLDRIVGPRLNTAGESRTTACVSAPKDDETHPRKIVVNAFTRRGAKVFATQGAKLLFRRGFPVRDGYGPASPLEFSL
jgi:beta-lactamase superfamily II metal-dependent hydrolase